MKRKSLILCFAIAILAIAMPCLAKVATANLEKLIEISDYIVIGKVANIIQIKKVVVAEVEIEQILKGTLKEKNLYYLAQPTWNCDTSTAIRGERVLLFLVKAPARISGMGFKEPPGFRKALAERTKKAPFCIIAWSGRGRKHLSKVKDIWYVTFRPYEIVWPNNIKIEPNPLPESSPDIKAARLDEITEYVKAKVKKSGQK